MGGIIRERRTYNSDRGASNAYLGSASHYLTDVSNPMHTGGESWQIVSELGGSDSSLDHTSVHAIYETIIGECWNTPPNLVEFTFSQEDTFDGQVSPMAWPGSVEALTEGMGRFSHKHLTDKFIHAVQTGAKIQNNQPKDEAKIYIYNDKDIRKATTECLREALARSMTLVRYTQGMVG
jgi:hypothetical protein